MRLHSCHLLPRSATQEAIERLVMRPRLPLGDMTHEARRYCHGDDAWTDWRPCTAQQAAEYRLDGTFQVRTLEPNVQGKGPAR